jgi:hypothetical protein
MTTIVFFFPNHMLVSSSSSYYKWCHHKIIPKDKTFFTLTFFQIMTLIYFKCMQFLF